MSIFDGDVWIYFAIGLVVIVAFSHRQFNEPSWQNDSNIIQRLAPSEIIGRSTYYSAYLLYLLMIVAVYVLFCFSAKAAEVLSTVISILIDRAPAAGAVGGSVGGTAGGAADSAGQAARQVDPDLVNRSVPEFPLLVALAMGALMRIPYIQRVEHWIRAFAHWVFGIPTVQIKLLDKMLGTGVDMPLLEEDLRFEDGEERISDRIDRYAEAGSEVLGGAFRKSNFKAKLETILAFRVWISDQRIYPSQRAAHSETFTALQDNVLDSIAMLENNLELLAARSMTDTPALNEAMQRELWSHRVKEVDGLSKDVCSVLALLTPDSDLPDETKPTARSLIAFLNASSKPNEAWRAQRSLTLMAMTFCAVWSALMGGLFAYGLRYWAVPELYDRDPGSSLFNEFTTARDWAVAGLLAFGIATYVAVSRRATMNRRGKWINAFAGRVWPFELWLRIFARCFAIVVLTYVAYYVFVTFMVPLQQLPMVVSQLRGTLLGYLKEIVTFGMIAGLHGVFVALLMDAEDKRFRGSKLMKVMAVHVGSLAVAGLIMGIYISRIKNSTDLEVFQLRMLIYALWPAGVALIVGWSISQGCRRAVEEDPAELEDYSAPVLP